MKIVENIPTTHSMVIKMAVFLEIVPFTRGLSESSFDSSPTLISAMSFNTNPYIAEKAPIKKSRARSFIDSMPTLTAPKTWGY